MLTLSQILPYLQNSPDRIPAKLRHEYYEETIKYKAELAAKFSKTYPDYLAKNHPRERSTDKEYRKDTYINPFKNLTTKIGETLDYIKEADDFDISFPALPNGIDEENSLEKYTGNSLTPDGSLIEWFFNYAVDSYINDPNACTAMVLTEPPADDKFAEDGLFAPLPMLFPSENVIAHRKGRFCVLLSPEKYIFTDIAGVEHEGAVLHFFDHESYTAAFEIGQVLISDNQPTQIDWRIIGLKKEVGVNQEGVIIVGTALDPIPHHADSMPVHKLGKLRKAMNARREEMYESIMEAAIPHIMEGQQVQSDIQVERHFHVTSTEWRRKSALPKCTHPKCQNGHIYLKSDVGAIIEVKTCPTCKGQGVIQPSGSGLEVLWVNDADAATIGTDPTSGGKGAPGGYIERSIEPIKQLTLDQERIEKKIYTKLNMQFIQETPLATSGTSKRFDREELYRELNTQAAHLLWLLTNNYSQTDRLRYAIHSKLPGEQTPQIIVPVRFNLENAEMTREELNDAKQRNYDPAIVNALELRLLEYSVGKNSTEYEQYVTRMSLDPFRSSTPDQKNMITGLVRTNIPDGTELDACMREIMFSLLFNVILTRATETNEDFYTKTIAERRAIMDGIMPMYFKTTRPSIAPGSAPGQSAAAFEDIPPYESYTVRPQVNFIDSSQTYKQQEFQQHHE